MDTSQNHTPLGRSLKRHNGTPAVCVSNMPTLINRFSLTSCVLVVGAQWSRLGRVWHGGLLQHVSRFGSFCGSVFWYVPSICNMVQFCILGLVPSTCSKAVVLSTRRHTLHTPVVCPEVIVAAVQYNQKYNHEVRANIYIKNSTIYNMQTLYTIYTIRCLAVPGFLFIYTQDQMI